LNITISPQVAARHPTYGAGVLLAKNIQLNARHAGLISAVIDEALAKMIQAEHQALAEIECQGWRGVYKQMELKASKVLCSFESMYKRARKSGSLPRINPLVDVYNAISLKHALCLGAYDLEEVKGAIEIRFAAEGESLLPIGASEARELGPKAIIYADQAGPICAWWNHRDADRTKVEEGTRDGIFFVDDLNLADGRAQRAIDDLSALIGKIAEPGVQLQKLVIAGSTH